MKIFRFIYLVAVMLVLSFQSGFAVQLSNDEFDNGSLDGWQGDGYTLNNDGWMYIDRDKTAYKTYDFGEENANKGVTIVFTFQVPDTWEDNGDYIDYLELSIDGNLEKSYLNPRGTRTVAYTTQTDEHGQITLSFIQYLLFEKTNIIIL